jgi:hypothetical protein
VVASFACRLPPLCVVLRLTGRHDCGVCCAVVCGIGGTGELFPAAARWTTSTWSVWDPCVTCCAANSRLLGASPSPRVLFLALYRLTGPGLCGFQRGERVSAVAGCVCRVFTPFRGVWARSHGVLPGKAPDLQRQVSVVRCGGAAPPDVSLSCLGVAWRRGRRRGGCSSDHRLTVAFASSSPLLCSNCRRRMCCFAMSSSPCY